MSIDNRKQPGFLQELLIGFAQLGQHLQILERAVALLLIGALTGLVLVQGLFRHLADGPPDWIPQAVAAGLLWLIMVGAVIAAGQAGHLRISLLDRLLPDLWACLIHRILLAMTGLACLFLMGYSLRAVGLERAFSETTFFDLPAWYVQLIVPLGFLLMAARFLARAAAPLVALLLQPPGSDNSPGVRRQ